LAVTIKAEGQASKRGIIARLPTPDQLIADAQRWVDAEYRTFVRRSQPGDGTSDGVPTAVLEVDLHPAADPISISVDAEGIVRVAADASNVGPGYQTFVARLLERMGDELRITWSEPAGSRPIDGPPAWVGARVVLADRSAVERDHLALLGRQLTRASEQCARGVAGIQVGMRPGTRFAFDGAIGTMLGPRDRAWLERALKDPRVATDIRPWWPDAPDAHYVLKRALVLLWTEIRWRQPADDRERATVDEALGLLRWALSSDPTLAYPWREWAELIALRGLPDPASAQVVAQAEQMDASLPLIGYRRHPVTIDHEGWVLRVPGSFGEVRKADEWSGSDRGRMVTLAATVTRTASGHPQSADWFLTRVASDLGTGVLHHQEGELRGVARLTTDASSGVEVAVLEGFSALTGSGAAIRIQFEEVEDYRWAIDLWRSLRPARI
jgi:hypothetical protein